MQHRRSLSIERISDPADKTIVYAVSATDGSLKGTLVNANGVYSDTATDELVSKLIVNSHKS